MTLAQLRRVLTFSEFSAIMLLSNFIIAYAIQLKLIFVHARCRQRISKGLEKIVNSEKLGNALSKSKDIAMTLLGNVLYRTRIEPIRDADGLKGMKARWIGDPGEDVIEINTPSGSADLTIDGNTAPTIEYVQDGEKRTIAVRDIKNLSCELDRETMDEIATPRGASIAICIGAGVGLLGWFLITVMRALPAPRTAQDDSAAMPPIDPIKDRDK